MRPAIYSLRCLLVTVQPPPTSGCKARPNCSYWDKEKAFTRLHAVRRRQPDATCSTWKAASSTPGRSAPTRICWTTATSWTPSKDDPSGFQGFQEVDWDGKTVWEYTEKREGYAPHHDWVRIFNKKLNAPTTLYIANKSITHEQAIAAGADPTQRPLRRRPDGRDRRGGHAGQRRLGMVVLRSRRAGPRPGEAQLRRRRARRSPTIRAGSTSTCPAGR